MEDRSELVNYEAEQALLGAILADNDALERVGDTLTSSMFAEAAHGRIFDACRALIADGRAANAVTLKARFERDEALAQVGGARYLAELQGNYVGAAMASDYAGVIVDLWLRRRSIGAAEFLTDQLQDFNEGARPVRDLLEDHIREVDAVLTRDRDVRGLVPVGSDSESLKAEIREAVERHRSGQTSGMSTGYPRLDAALCGGLRPGRLLVLGGATSMGKTALAVGIADRVARASGPVAIFSMEMLRGDLERRIAATRAEVDLGATLRGNLGAEDAAALEREIDLLRGLPIYVDDSFQTSPAAMRIRARRLARKHGLSLVVIDYLQLMSDPDLGRQNRVTELTAITRSIKLMAMELRVPVVLLSQLTREHARREGHRPMLSDLRESGSIEQDADDVVFCFRPAYYMERDRPAKQKEADRVEYDADIDAKKSVFTAIVAKQRNGPLTDVNLRFDAATTRVWDPDEAQPDIPF